MPQLNVDRGVFLLPDDMSFERATFIEPLACIIRGQRLAGLKPGQAVLVLGSGISGLLHVLLAKVSGSDLVIATDINERRLAVARDFGADLVLSALEDVSSRVKETNKGRLADVVIVCTGAYSAFTQSLQCVDRGGTVLFFAPTEPDIELSVPVNEFWRNEIKLLTSYGASPADIYQALVRLSSPSFCVEKMITHRLSMQEAGLGFKMVAEAKDSVKVIIEPQR